MRFRLIESKADQQKLIDFAGEKIATQFFDNRKFYKSPENDIYYWLKKSPEELKDFMEKHKTTNQKTKTEIEEILESPEANEVDLIGKQDGYTIYRIYTPEASVKYGLVVGGKAGWCISGGYYDGKEDEGILEEARHYFDEYLDTAYEAYYFIIGHNTKYALCVKSIDDNNQAVCDIWDQKDNTVKYIPGLSNLYDEDDDVLLYKKEIEFKISNGKLVKFTNVNNVSEVTIPDGVTSIGEDAFRGCTGLTSIVIPDSVTSIGDGAFWGCTYLKNITIGNSVTSIGYGAFYICTDLKNVYYNGTIKEWCGIKFGYSGSNPCYKADNLYIDGQLITGNLIIPEGVTSIGEFAFYCCTKLTSIVIPDSVASIGFNAFYNCTGLKNIVIPDSVTNISDYAFENCTNLTSITFEGTKSQWQKITDNIDLGIDKNRCVVHCANDDIQARKSESYAPRFKRRLN